MNDRNSGSVQSTEESSKDERDRFVIEAFAAVACALQELTAEERRRVLTAVAILDGYELAPERTT